MSLDDFYLLGSGLLMTQTSIGVFNVSLFTELSPHSLLAWQRVRLANSLAHSGEEWAHIFSKYNSGEVLLMWVKTRRVRGGFLKIFIQKQSKTKQLLHTFQILKHGLCVLNWTESVGVLHQTLKSFQMCQPATWWKWRGRTPSAQLPFVCLSRPFDDTL